MRVVRGVEEVSERELVHRLRRGDQRALKLAYTRHAARVHGFLLRLCGDRALAEDLFQESWLKLAQAAPSLLPDTELGAWLFAVGRNAFFSHARKHARTVGLDEALEPSDETLLPDRELGAALEVARVELGLQRLSVIDREVLLLVGVEGLSHERAAEVLALEPAAFRKRLSRARARLHATLASESTSAKRSSNE